MSPKHSNRSNMQNEGTDIDFGMIPLQESLLLNDILRNFDTVDSVDTTNSCTTVQMIQYIGRHPIHYSVSMITTCPGNPQDMKTLIETNQECKGSLRH